MALSMQQKEEEEKAAREAAMKEAAENLRKTQVESKPIGETLAAPMEAASTAPMPDEPIEMKHILVIDDDLMMLRLVKAELKERYNVATAVSGKIGMKFLERRTTDLILLDYEMPEENGAEVLKKLRANPMTRNIPVVFLTGMNNREIIKQLVAMKPQGYLLKPIKCEQLVQTIQSIIG